MTIFAIVGTRTKYLLHPIWWERCVWRYVSRFLQQNDTVCSGGAAGPDHWSALAARAHGIKVIEFLPDWEQYGRGAAFKRNWQIAEACDRMVAFWDEKSKGTEHVIECAEAKQKPVLIINPEKYKHAEWIEDSDYAF